MAVNFQYNKTSLQQLNKQLKVRRNALPILKNKEAALRVEVKKARDRADAAERELQAALAAHEGMNKLWEEFDLSLAALEEVVVGKSKTAGVATPVLEELRFVEPPCSLFTQPAWFPKGRALLKQWTELTLRQRILAHSAELLEHARKKTTQKVNLYEKVQIPDYEDAIRKVKRYLEDEENLAKAAQKIVKKRQERANTQAA